MKRLHRLTAILIKFQSTKSVKAKDLSATFDVSVRTIYRDIKALEEAGVPIGYEPGEAYFLMEGYQLPPVHFTAEESQAIVTARALVGQNKDASLVGYFNKAVEKVTAVMRTTEKRTVFEFHDRIAPSISPSPKSSDSLIDIQRCIIEFRSIRIRYKASNGSETERTVNPLALYFTQDHWIMVAFCQLRNDQREFRLDRISKLEFLSESFPPNQFTLDHYFKKYR